MTRIGELPVGPGQKAPPSLGPSLWVEKDTLAARPALGLTAYLAEPEWWARDGVKRALDAFLQVVPQDRLLAFTSSLLTEWRPLPKGSRALELDRMDAWTPLGRPPRHHFFLRFADVPNLPEIGFSYTEIDSRRADRSGVLELTLPLAAPPKDLLRLADALIQLGALDALVGGYVARWNVTCLTPAFDQIYLWTRRFLGLDVQDAEEMAWRTPRALPATNWLTYLGTRPAGAREIDVAALAARPWSSSVDVIHGPSGLFLRAGPNPSLADLNGLALPVEYREVATALEAALVPDPPLLWGAFRREPERTRRWLRRWIDVGEWPPP
jgi:hypothetical protein